MPQGLTFKDKSALEEILRRKTADIPGPIKASITLPIDAIIAPTPQQQHYPFNVANVNEGTTFAGILKYRGEVMTNLKNELPIQKWSEQAILTYFCSCVEKNLNFSRFFGETRARLLANLAARLSDSDTPLQAAYTLACMEYVHHTSLGQQLDPANPTKHMLRFAWHFRRQPEQFIVLDSDRTENPKHNTTKYLARFRNSAQWEETKPETQILFDFLFQGGKKALDDAATKPKKKKVRGKGKKGVGSDSTGKHNGGTATNTSPEASMSSPAQLPTLYYESSRIRDYCLNNPLLQGLIADMPGVRGLGFTVEIFDIGDLSDFNAMSLEEADDSYEDDMGYMADDDKAMEIDNGGVLILTGADLERWLARRDE